MASVSSATRGAVCHGAGDRRQRRAPVGDPSLPTRVGSEPVVGTRGALAPRELVAVGPACSTVIATLRSRSGSGWRRIAARPGRSARTTARSGRASPTGRCAATAVLPALAHDKLHQQLLHDVLDREVAAEPGDRVCCDGPGQPLEDRQRRPVPREARTDEVDVAHREARERGDEVGLTVESRREGVEPELRAMPRVDARRA